jgi:aminoglycoside 2'-N-acetyltransferase I
MGAVGGHVRARYDLGGLSTGSPAFYARLGWLRWEGPTWVEGPDGRVRTPEDDGGVMVLPTAQLPEPDRSTDITCRWRSGDVW